MILTVILHRQQKEEPGYGTIRAWVEQGALRGDNLLAGRMLTKIESAIDGCREKIRREFAAHLGGIPEVHFRCDSTFDGEIANAAVVSREGLG